MAANTARRTGLQRGVGVALWRQIADAMRREIASGITDARGRLPSEGELAARYGVNRHTVRVAIAALAQEGVLQSIQGRGTFVRRQKRLVYPIGERTRFSAGLEGQTRERQTVMLSHRSEPAMAEISRALRMAPGDEVVVIESLGRADGVAVSRSTSWFCAHRFPNIAAVFERTGSISAAFRTYGINDYRRASTAVEARHADSLELHDLGLSAGAIVIVTRALNVDADAIPLQYSLTRFPADRVELVLETS